MVFGAIRPLNASCAPMGLLHERAGTSGLLALLEDVALEASVVPEVVEMLHAQGVRLAWPDVERLLVRFPDAGRRHRVLQLLVVGAKVRPGPHCCAFS